MDDRMSPKEVSTWEVTEPVDSAGASDGVRALMLSIHYLPISNAFKSIRLADLMVVVFAS